MKGWTFALVLAAAACGPAPQQPTTQAAANEASPSARPETVADRTPAQSADEAGISACLLQDGETIPQNALHAIGTEPFWGADVKGRCVTYSTPEDQDGVRIWTRFEGTSENGQWSGALDGQPFVMTTKPEPGCSDGMSDNLYPIAVILKVRGEERRGCAAPTSEWRRKRGQ
jgi:uncharacterized membrane protein